MPWSYCQSVLEYLSISSWLRRQTPCWHRSSMTLMRSLNARSHWGHRHRPTMLSWPIIDFFQFFGRYLPEWIAGGVAVLRCDNQQSLHSRIRGILLGHSK